MTQSELSAKTLVQLRQIARELNIPGTQKKNKADLISLILDTFSKQNESSNPSSVPDSSPSTSQAVNTPTKTVVTINQNGLTKEEIPLQPSPTQSNTSTHATENSSKSLTTNTTNTSQNGNSFADPTIEVNGVLEIMADGTHGVLRSQKLTPSSKDTYISISQVKKLKLRKGDLISGIARLPKDNERYNALMWIKSVNGVPIEELKDRIHFDELKPVYPNRQIKLECGQFPIANRIIDLLAPIGFGQRAMIVAPPKAGKTTLLKDIAKGINSNYPDVQLMVVLIGERPEEVTDIERSINGIVYASNFDESPQDQVSVAELSLERAKRMVEQGKDVVILMDSLTRLARAYNVALPASGRTLSGGLDPVALYPSKKFFGAARNFENGASLTIVATALVDTGSKMDDVIFEEFKGTGNMELKLSRKEANRRNFPAIVVMDSGTRNEELLFSPDMLQISWKIRKMLESLGDDALPALLDRMKGTKDNQEFIKMLYQ